MPTTAWGVPSLIREARQRADMTQAELAHRLGISQPAVAKLERAGANPTVETLDRVLSATGRRLMLDAPERGPGVDESLIRRQLELTPAQRIQGIETMYSQMRALTQAGADARDRTA